MKISITHAPKAQSPRGLNFLRAVLFIAAIAMLFMGIRNQEVGTVFQKAVNICLECIGIG